MTTRQLKKAAIATHGTGPVWMSVSMVLALGDRDEVKPWEAHRFFADLGGERHYFPAFTNKEKRTGTWWLVDLQE